MIKFMKIIDNRNVLIMKINHMDITILYEKLYSKKFPSSSVEYRSKVSFMLIEEKSPVAHLIILNM